MALERGGLRCSGAVMEEATQPTEANENYELLDSGGGRVLEKWGAMTFTRPGLQIWWRRKLPGAEWKKALEWKRESKEPMRTRFGKLTMLIGGAGGSPRALGPELRDSWERVTAMCVEFSAKMRRPARVLHLFGGVGGHTLAAALGGASVAHVEASTESLSRARENAALNTAVLPSRDIRWVLDDPVKFAQREKAQNSRHDLIILDPHASREAKQGFDLERGLGPLLATASGLLSDSPLAIVLVCRQGGVSPTTLLNLMRHELSIFGGTFECGELLLRGTAEVQAAACGAFCQWRK
jgi:23S rRNA (cytosine1962-C5)-methyltransferase